MSEILELQPQQHRVTLAPTNCVIVFFKIWSPGVWVHGRVHFFPSWVLLPVNISTMQLL